MNKFLGLSLLFFYFTTIRPFQYIHSPADCKHPSPTQETPLPTLSNSSWTNYKPCNMGAMQQNRKTTNSSQSLHNNRMPRKLLLKMTLWIDECRFCQNAHSTDSTGILSRKFICFSKSFFTSISHSKDGLHHQLMPQLVVSSRYNCPWTIPIHAHQGMWFRESVN